MHATRRRRRPPTRAGRWCVRTRRRARRHRPRGRPARTPESASHVGDRYRADADDHQVGSDLGPVAEHRPAHPALAEQRRSARCRCARRRPRRCAGDRPARRPAAPSTDASGAGCGSTRITSSPDLRMLAASSQPMNPAPDDQRGAARDEVGAQRRGRRRACAARVRRRGRAVRGCAAARARWRSPGGRTRRSSRRPAQRCGRRCRARPPGRRGAVRCLLVEELRGLEA